MYRYFEVLLNSCTPSHKIATTIGNQGYVVLPNLRRAIRDNRTLQETGMTCVTQIMPVSCKVRLFRLCQASFKKRSSRSAMATPASRIFVLYIDAPAAAAQSRPHVLDKVATRGCSGFLILPEPQTDAPDAALKAVLGVDGGAPNSDGLFAYPKMPVAFFSDSQEPRAFAKAVGVADVHSIANTSDSQASVSPRLAELLRVEEPTSKHLVLVHLTEYQPGHWIFAFLEKLLGSEATASSDDCFISVLQTAQRPHITDAQVAAHPLRPRQSFERHNGQYPTSGSSSQPPRLLFSSFHCDRTRRDDATQFTEHDVETRGAYGAMDARIFMKEQAFRLGFAPKYGA